MSLLETCSRYGQRVHVVPRPNDLTADARWLVAAMPELLEHELCWWWYGNEIQLHSAATLADAQRGYDGPGWSAEWTVFANMGGDPMFRRAETRDVATAICGVGSWSSIVMAPDLESWAAGMVAWLQLTFDAFDGRPFDRGELKPGFEARLLERLTPIVGPSAIAWLPT